MPPQKKKVQSKTREEQDNINSSIDDSSSSKHNGEGSLANGESSSASVDKGKSEASPPSSPKSDPAPAELAQSSEAAHPEPKDKEPSPPPVSPKKISSPKPASVSDVNTEQSKRELLMAVLARDVERLPELIDKVLIGTKGNLSYKEGVGEYTLLHRCAVQGGDPAVIKVLLDFGADVNVLDAKKSSALYITAQKGDIKLAELLLERGAKVGLPAIDGKTPLHLVARTGNLEFIQLLLNNKNKTEEEPFINMQDLQGYTALHYAAKYGFRECVETLLEHGADLGVQDKDGNVPGDLVDPEHGEAKKLLRLLKKVPKTRKPTESAGTKSGKEGGLGKSASSPEVSGKITAISYDGRVVTPGMKISGKGKNKSTASLPSATLEPSGSSSSSSSMTESGESSMGNSKVEDGEGSTPAPVSNEPKLDRYGFVKRNDSAVLEDKKMKKTEIAMATKWIKLMKNWDNTYVKKYKPKLQKYCDRGIPDAVRGEVWKLLANSQELKQQGNYRDYVGLDTEMREQISRDIHRTMPNHFLFREESGQGQQALSTVLCAFAAYNPAVGYCQGMGFITAMFLMYMPEEDAFWMLVRMADAYTMAGLWMPSLPMLGLCMYVLQALLKEHLPKIHAHLDQLGVSAAMYAPQFFITGYLYSLPFPVGLRIWDSFLVRDFYFLYAVALALFKVYQDQILTFEFEALMDFLKFDNLDAARREHQPPHFDPNEIIDTAVAFTIKPSHIQELEEEFRIIKKQPKEDQERTASNKQQLRKMVRAEKKKEKEKLEKERTDSLPPPRGPFRGLREIRFLSRTHSHKPDQETPTSSAPSLLATQQAGGSGSSSPASSSSGASTPTPGDSNGSSKGKKGEKKQKKDSKNKEKEKEKDKDQDKEKDDETQSAGSSPRRAGEKKKEDTEEEEEGEEDKTDASSHSDSEDKNKKVGKGKKGKR